MLKILATVSPAFLLREGFARSIMVLSQHFQHSSYIPSQKPGAAKVSHASLPWGTVHDGVQHWLSQCVGGLLRKAESPAALMLNTEAQRQAARKQVAEILHNVYWEDWTPLQGLARWPYPAGQDASLDVAFQALAHLEGDEDRHQQEPYWLDAQLAWIDALSKHLATGQALSSTVLGAYLYTGSLTTSPAWEHWLLWQPIVRIRRQVEHFWQLFMAPFVRF